jgi:hypothetical protein
MAHPRGGPPAPFQSRNVWWPLKPSYYIYTPQGKAKNSLVRASKRTSRKAEEGKGLAVRKKAPDPTVFLAFCACLWYISR